MFVLNLLQSKSINLRPKSKASMLERLCIPARKKRLPMTITFVLQQSMLTEWQKQNGKLWTKKREQDFLLALATLVSYALSKDAKRKLHIWHINTKQKEYMIELAIGGAVIAGIALIIKESY